MGRGIVVGNLALRGFSTVVLLALLVSTIIFAVWDPEIGELQGQWNDADYDQAIAGVCEVPQVGGVCKSSTDHSGFQAFGMTDKCYYRVRDICFDEAKTIDNINRGRCFGGYILACRNRGGQPVMIRNEQENDAVLHACGAKNDANKDKLTERESKSCYIGMAQKDPEEKKDGWQWLANNKEPSFTNWVNNDVWEEPNNAGEDGPEGAVELYTKKGGDEMRTEIEDFITTGKGVRTALGVCAFIAGALSSCLATLGLRSKNKFFIGCGSFLDLGSAACALGLGITIVVQLVVGVHHTAMFGIVISFLTALTLLVGSCLGCVAFCKHDVALKADS